MFLRNFDIRYFEFAWVQNSSWLIESDINFNRTTSQNHPVLLSAFIKSIFNRNESAENKKNRCQIELYSTEISIIYSENINIWFFESCLKFQINLNLYFPLHKICRNINGAQVDHQAVVVLHDCTQTSNLLQ